MPRIGRDLDAARFELLLPRHELLARFHAPGGVGGAVVVVRQPRLEVVGTLGADVIEEGDGAAGAAVEEEMQEVGMAFAAPAARGDDVGELKAQLVAVELDRLLQLPGGPGRVVHAVQFHALLL